jgi:hypothetical protein
MAAEFTDNLVEFLEDKLKEFNPNIAVGEGTAIRDLFIKPFTVVFQPIVDEILSVRANLSLEGAENLTEEDLDRLAANFFITRKAGAKATGTVRLFFNAPVDEFVPQGTTFIASNGVRFVSTVDVTITSSGLQLNTFGDLFFQDVPAEAETAGVSGNVPADLVTDLLVGSDTVVDITNPAPFSGGIDTETNEQLVERLSIAITFRNLINKPGAKLILLENFPRLLDVLPIGFGDKHTIDDEVVGVGDGIDTTFQLSETEDVIPESLEVTLGVADETVLLGPGVTPGFKLLDFFPYTASTLELKAGASFVSGAPLVAGTHFVAGQTVLLADELVFAGPTVVGPLPAVDFIPIAASPALEVRAGATFAGGVLLTTPTHYTVVLATGVISLTAAGSTLVNAQVPPDVHAKYTATSASSAAFALLPAGATFVNTAIPPNLHAKYTAGPIDTGFVSVDFFGAVTFAVPPGSGTSITADFTYYLMRRDRMSGTGLVLGDDSFGTVTNVHIGGKVDFYLKFLGLEEREVRINTLKDENFLFDESPSDPAPTGIQQYVAGFPLPLIAIRNIEKIDPGTNLPSGVFLASPADYGLVIMPNKLNVNMSMRQKLRLDITNVAFLGTDVLIRYFTHQDYAAVQAFVDDDVNRIITADLLARAPMPVFIDIALEYSRVSGGPDSATLQQSIINYINGLNLGKCLTMYGLSNALVEAGAKFVVLPVTMSGTRVNLDFSTVAVSSQNEIEVPPNFQFIARSITVAEVAFEDCSSL